MKRGFTLIELAIVILVIGILAGLMLRNMGGFTASARDTRRIGDLRNVQTYLAQYFVKMGTYPATSTWAGLETELRRAGVIATGTSFVNDPVRTKTYGYTYCTSSPDGAPHYIIYAELEASNINTSPELFRDALVGTPNNWGWNCLITNLLCATSSGTNIYTHRFCVGQ